MSYPPQPANSNDAAFSCAPWAAWHIAGLRAWSAATVASLESIWAFQRVWLETSQAMVQTAAPQRPTTEPDTPVMLAAVMDDLRDCGVVVMKAQADVLDSWRRSA